MVEITPQEIRKTLDALDLEDTGTPEGNLKAIAEFVFESADASLEGTDAQDIAVGVPKLIKLFNANKKAGTKDLEYNGAYTKELNAGLLKSARTFRASEEYGELKQATEKKLGFGGFELDIGDALASTAIEFLGGDSYIPEKIKEEPKRLVKLVENAESIFKCLEAYHSNVVSSVDVKKDAAVQNKDETSDTNKASSIAASNGALNKHKVLQQYEAQSDFLEYKNYIYQAEGDEAVQVPPGNHAHNFYKYHDIKVEQLLEEFETLINDIPNEDGVDDLMDEAGFESVPKPSGFANNYDEYRNKAAEFMKLVISDEFQTEVKKHQKEWLWIDLPKINPFGSVPLGRVNVGLDLEEQGLFSKITRQMTLAVNVPSYLEKNIVGPNAESIPNFDALQQSLANKPISGVWNPGGPYAVAGIGSEDLKAHVEFYKNKIGAVAKVGYLDKDIDDLHYNHVNDVITDAREALKNLKSHVSELAPELDQLLSEDNDPLSWHSDTWAQNAESFGLLLDSKADVILNKSGRVPSAKESLEKLEKAYSDLNEAYIFGQSFAPKESFESNFEAFVVAPPDQSNNAQEPDDNSGDVSGNENGSDTPEDKTSVAAATKRVETVLQDIIAPFMAPVLERINQKLEFDGAPDEKFDDQSQIALQKFFIGADFKKLADLGDKPWLYTEENGAKLSAGIKAHIAENPALILDQVNNDPILKGAINKLFEVDSTKPLFSVVDNNLVWAQDIKKDGKVLAVAGETKIEGGIKDLIKGQTDKKIDEFFTDILLLSNNNILSTEQLASMSDMMPPMFGLILGILSFLGLDTPEILGAINSFAQTEFAQEVLGIPKGFDVSDAMGDNSFAAFTGMTGSEENKSSRLQKLYSDALEASGGDSALLKEHLKTGLAGIFTDLDDNGIDKIIDDALSDVENSKLGHTNPDGSYQDSDLDAKTFVASIVTSKADETWTEGTPLVDEFLERGLGYQIYVNDSEGVPPDPSDKNYIHPHNNSGVKTSKVFDREAIIDKAIEGSNDKYAGYAAAKRVSDLEYHAASAPQVYVDGNGQPKLVFIDGQREECLIVIEEQKESYEKQLGQYQKQVNEGLEQVRRIQEKIEKGEFTDYKLEVEFKKDLAIAKANLQQLLNTGKGPELAHKLKQQYALLEEMSGSQYRVIDPNVEGYAEIADQFRHGYYRGFIDQETGRLDVAAIDKRVKERLGSKGLRVESIEGGGVALVPEPQTRKERREERRAQKNKFNKSARGGDIASAKNLAAKHDDTNQKRKDFENSKKSLENGFASLETAPHKFEKKLGFNASADTV